MSSSLKPKLFSLILLLSLLISACSFGAQPTATPVPAATAAPQATAVAPTAAPTAAAALPTATTAAPAATSQPTAAATATKPPAAGTATAPATAAKAGTFEKAACPFRLPTGLKEGTDLDCGYVVAPEDRSDPNSRMIRLAVAVFHNPHKTSNDPIIYLSGGPGGSALDFAYLAYPQQVEPLFPSGRDVILFDQRGVGLSKPALDCPAASELELTLLSQKLNGKLLSKQEQYDTLLTAYTACQKDLAGTAKLSSYNSVSNAADVEDIRKALGYDKLNLWGISYGTRLALEVMRTQPQGVRSVVLDSVYPPNVNVYTQGPANAMRAFTTVFDGCAANTTCNATYPNLRTVFFDVANSLNKNPANITATNPLNGKTYDVLLDGDTFLSTIFEMLYQTDMIPSLPEIIYQAKNGNYEQIAQYTGIIIANDAAMSPGMNYSVQCNEEYPFTSLADFEAALAKYPELKGMYGDSTKLQFALCGLWGAGKAAATEKQPVTSTLPTLVMSGAYDPITPPAWGQDAAKTLANSYFFQYPGMGHGTSVDNACPTGMMINFVKDPTKSPDSTCIPKMGEPKFIVPTRPEDIKLVPYTDTQLGISGVTPEGWEQVNTGTWTRGQSSLDQTALLQFASPNATSAQFASAILPQLGVTATPKSTGDYKTPALTWKLYQTDSTVQGQNLSVAWATADQNGIGYLVLMVTNPNEMEGLHKAVFLPVLDALKPLKG